MSNPTVCTNLGFCELLGISTERRVRRKKRMPDEVSVDTFLSWHDEIKRDQLQIMDRLNEEMIQRVHHIREINMKFGFLSPLGYIPYPPNDNDINTKIKVLTDLYDEVIARELQVEIHRLRRHVKIHEETTGMEADNGWH